MQFNLIDERWLPVTRRDGTATMIAPWEVTDRFADNPVVALNAPRPDFNGALIQFLIGLVQTVAAPSNGSEWRKKLAEPPSPDDLKAVFATVRHAFELGGNGPRFMQDFEDISAGLDGIDGLLIESPGEHTKELNIDHFIKRDSVKAMCPCCCAAALFAFQTNSPSGGPGYMTSLRGGGPLSTLVLGDNYHATLWQLIFLNVLEQGKFLDICGNPNLTSGKEMFPWLGETRKGRRKKGSEFYGEYTTPEVVHPVTMYWAMPRRIRLSLVDLAVGICSVCGINSDSLIDSYKEIPGGASYGGAWLHPLSPYYEKTAKGETNVLPLHAQPGGISYRHWLGLVMSDGGDMPSRIVHDFINNRQKRDWQFRLWAFGYDMDNMKARCWYESTMPLLYVDPAIRGEFEQYAAGMIKAASEIAGNARSAVKKAWFRRPGDAKGDTTFVDGSFWQQTESVFYEALNSMKSALESGNDSLQARQSWHKTLCEHALKLFDSYAWEGPIEDADPKRVVIARRELENYNRGKKIKELLSLPVEQKAVGKAAQKKEVKPKQQEQAELGF